MINTWVLGLICCGKLYSKLASGFAAFKKNANQRSKRSSSLVTGFLHWPVKGLIFVHACERHRKLLISSPAAAVHRHLYTQVLSEQSSLTRSIVVCMWQLQLIGRAEGSCSFSDSAHCPHCTHACLHKTCRRFISLIESSVDRDKDAKGVTYSSNKHERG